LPVPYLVTEFIAGEICTEPSQLSLPVSDFSGQLAAVLARLHTAGFTRTDAPYPPDIRTTATHRMRARPAQPDTASRTGSEDQRLLPGVEHNARAIR